jgi:phage terminase large subunit-like protein
MRQSTRLVQLKSQAKRQGWLRWLRKGPGEEADERALLNGCWFDPQRAQHSIDFAARYGTLTEGAFKGQRFDLQPWQHDTLQRVFGWVRQSPEWGYPVRRFRYWYEEVPKKNGKTPLAALVGNYLLFADSFGRQINMHVAATTRKQAERLLTHAIRQVKNRADLNQVATIKKLEGFYCLGYGDSLWSCLSAEPESADGINGHVIADELHRWAGMEFYNTLRWALASQPEGLFVGITTAGDDMQSVCRTLHDKTEAVNAGRQIDEAFYGEIFAADRDDDPHQEKTWYKANPSLGTTRKHPLKLSTFRADYEAAKLDPTQWPTWLRLRLNVWQSSTGSWIDELGGIGKWDAGEALRRAAGSGDPRRAQGDPRRAPKRIDCFEGFTPKDLEGHNCYVAFDGATHHDTTAAVFAFPDPAEDETVRVLPYFWLPMAEAVKQQARVPYRAWAEAGHITLTEGDAVDFERVCADLVALIKQFKAARFYFDPLFQAEWLTQRIADETGIERQEFPQTIIHFAAPMAAASRLIVLHKLRHNGHPVLTWQLGHCQAKSDVNNNRRPVKRKKDDYRTVDGVTAMIMALKDAIGGEPGSFYDSNEVEWV